MRLYSEHRQRVQDRYLEIRDDLLCEIRYCEARTHERCTMRADQVQHLVGRGARRDLIDDPRNLMTICAFCHDWAEREPNAAERAGIVVRAHDWEWLVELHLDDTVPRPGSWDNRLVVALAKHGRPDLDG